MSELREAFLKSTGLTFDIDKLLDSLSEDKKTEIINKINWQMKSGIIVDNIKTEQSEHNVDTIIGVAKKLNLDNIDLDGDGEISDTEKQINEIISIAKEKKEEIVSYKEELTRDLIDSEEKLVKAIQNNNEVTLDADIVLSNYIEIRDKELTINLNGHKLYHPISSPVSYKDIFELYGTTKLIINGNGELFAEDGYCIYAAGDSSCEINGGKYISSVSCVDARKNAIVTINGGEFIVDGSNNPSGDFGQVYTLNLRDKKGNYENELANFIVKGGRFYNFNPSESHAEPKVTNFVANGYTVIENNDWFEVVKE